MATQTGVLKFTGRLGNLIGYRVGGEYYLRSMPQRVRQSPRSKISGRCFGKASKLGAAIRHALEGIMDTASESTLGNRLNRALLGVLRQDDLHGMKRFIPRHFRALEGFCFTPHAELGRLLTVAPVVTRDGNGNIEVAVPAMEALNGHPQATHISIKALAVCIRPGYTAATAEQSEPVLLEMGKSSEAFTLTVPASPDAVSCVILEVTSLQEEHGRMYMLRNRKYAAAEVIAVLPPMVEHRGAVTYSRDEAQARRYRQPMPYLPGMIIHSPQRE
ncbi:hypothetical protein [Chitinophaga sp. YIM B06452]|uniref:hypothetical protein n=1 Tax=Chitinophaga sp. YIM B06452 TaxID=3082158 RepID=UPI0031FE6FF3